MRLTPCNNGVYLKRVAQAPAMAPEAAPAAQIPAAQPAAQPASQPANTQQPQVQPNDPQAELLDFVNKNKNNPEFIADLKSLVQKYSGQEQQQAQAPAAPAAPLPGLGA